MDLLMKHQSNKMTYEEEYIVNSREVKLFTCRWSPVNCEPKALVFLCHGYAMECSISMRDCGTRLAEAGYEVHGLDCEGHGKSSGLQGFISNFTDLVDDVSEQYTNISEKRENKKRMRFLMGESMGGAVALLLHRKKPEYWDGAVLVAPMCKISDDVRPSPLVVKVLTSLARVIPTWKITPVPDIVDIAFRDRQVVQEIRSNPYTYKGRPRLMTANQLYIVTIDLEERLKEVNLPFIILHGEHDKVTDPMVSKLLYKSSPSADKTLKLYPEMWHSLCYGELPENTDVVFADIVKWLDERGFAQKSQLEVQQKSAGDQNALKNATVK